MEEKINEILAQLTLEEKVALVAGKDMWTTVPIERVGIPQMKVTDGPNGARGADMGGDITAASFPVGIALGATWNTNLLYEVGQALADEVKSKGAHVLLAPTVNIHRGVLNGRNFECYAEDPLLSGELAAAYIKGLQSRGVAACVKHYVGNDSEFERHSMSSDIGERALHEIYLRPFQTAVQDAQTWTLMSSYNKVNGTYVSESKLFLQDILKEEWGFDGAVISDWWGSYSHNAAAGGLDLEMPGPARFMGTHLMEMVQNGELDETLIDDKVRRILRTMFRTGVFDQPELQPEFADDRPETRDLIRRAGAEAIVLLKNENNLLPLDKERVPAIAVIGAGARWTPIMGGGSAQVAAHYAVSHLAGIQAAAGEDTAVHHTIGTPSTFKLMPKLETGWTNNWTAAIYNNYDLSGQPAVTQPARKAEIFPMNDMPAGIGDDFSIRYTTTFTPPESGAYTFSLVSGGLTRLLVNGELLIDNWTQQTKSELYFHQASTEVRGQVELIKGQPAELVIEYSARNAGLRVWRVGCLPPVAADSIAEAVQLASWCDVAIVFAGLSGEWESESYDRPHMDLPGEQNELITAVAAANPRTIVVLNTGSPVSMPWINEVSAVLQTWYPGQEAGNALADVLFGKADPSGRLPQTFPVRLQDNPTFINYPGENGHVLYGEGIFVGYRYYEKKEVAPLFPFGHGLSYTTFEFSNLRLNGDTFKPGDKIEVSVDVSNTGNRAGQEVVQVYVRDVAAKLVRPYKELKAFTKINLQPGQTQTVTLALDETALAYYDPAKPGWVAEAGEFEIHVGRSSQDIRLTAAFNWAGEGRVLDPLDKSTRLHVGLTLRELLADDTGAQVLNKHLSGMADHPQAQMAMDLTLEQIAGLVPNIITHEKLAAINADLARRGG
ncbi:MAG: glycoside hydrolase family 3 C-terminal domain-containing protein [Anaerolineae bacterium]|nr:glycoside hydrolase family 3 C-terminal domain-containing protein [Anaerolineae bacterium]